MIEATTQPTLHLVVPWYFALRRHCEPSAEDCELIATMKRRGLHYLRTNLKYEITSFHQVATLLCPSFRVLNMYTAAKRNSIVNEAKEMLNDKFPFEINSGANSTSLKK